MIGAIAGDIIGSVYEHRPIKDVDFPLFQERSTFTDDTVLTVAVAQALLRGTEYRDELKDFTRRYPGRGYGLHYQHWALSDQKEPYNSWGNGSAMRVSPIGFAFDSEEKVLKEAARSASVTHNHPEGIKGAQATALSIFLARLGEDKDAIRSRISSEFEYHLNRTVVEIRPEYSFDVSCQGSVPEALISFFDSTDFEGAVRNAVSLGGDSDTQACIAGGVAEAYYGPLDEILRQQVLDRLPEEFVDILERFEICFSQSKEF